MGKKVTKSNKGEKLTSKNSEQKKISNSSESKYKIDQTKMYRFNFPIGRKYCK